MGARTRSILRISLGNAIPVEELLVEAAAEDLEQLMSDIRSRDYTVSLSAADAQRGDAVGPDEIRKRLYWLFED